MAPLYPWYHDHLHLGQSVAVDVDEMINYLDSLITNPDLRHKMGEAARRHVIETLDWNHVIQMTLGLWQELAGIAQSLPHRQSSDRRSIGPDYFHDFRHYASHIITETQVIQITDSGREATKDTLDTYMLPEMRETLRVHVLQYLLRFMKSCSFFRQKITVQVLSEQVCKRFKITSEHSLRYILWLVKYGLLRIETGKNAN
jgi:hypothetical protein